MKKINPRFLIIGVLLALFLLAPQPSLAASKWQQVGGNGLGDATNFLLPTMEVWGSYIYAGVGRDVLGARIYRSSNGTTWNLMQDGFGSNDLNTLVDFKAFDHRLYATVGSEGGAPVSGEIWRSDTNGDTWTQFGTDGLGAAANTEFFQLQEFGGDLYVGSINAGGGQLFRTDGVLDGTPWENITANGFGDPNNIAIWGLASYDGYLWAGTENMTGAQIWRSTTGNAGSWTKYYDYATEGFPQYTVVNLFFSFKGHLYWSAGNMTTGAQIAKRLTDTTFSYSTNGLGDANNIRLSENALKLGDQIYFGTFNPSPGGTGGELFSSTDGLNATQIGADGFGDANNYALYAVAFRKFLYVGFSNATTGLQMYRRYSASSPTPSEEAVAVAEETPVTTLTTTLTTLPQTGAESIFNLFRKVISLVRR